MLGADALTADTAYVLNIPFTKVYAQDAQKVVFMATMLDIPTEALGMDFTARAYARVKVDGVWQYLYEAASVTRSPAGVANQFYLDASDAVRARLDQIFAGCDAYTGANTKPAPKTYALSSASPVKVM
jgi:hypothetical protein